MTCACCGHELINRGVQTYPAKYNLPNRVLVECVNTRCKAYKRTATSETHQQICEDAHKEQAAQHSLNDKS